MKLQIKTLNQKSLVVDIEETNTVYQLKKELSLYPDIGVKPELQKLIYAGKILCNDDKLSTYNIDVKKFLVIMILKQPLEEPPIAAQKPNREDVKETSTKAEQKEKDDASSTTPSATAAKDDEFKTPTSTTDSKKKELVSQIVSMGYPESAVRRALAASFYNPERAIQYLVEGIPTSPSTPEGESFSDTFADEFLPPLEALRNEPLFKKLRSAVRGHPEYIDAAIHKIGILSPWLLELINENRQEFLDMLHESSDEE